MDSSFAQRRQEIEAKKAKLAELKRQRELRREQQATSSRQSNTASPLGEVRRPVLCLPAHNTDTLRRCCRPHHDGARISTAEQMSIVS